MIDTRREAQAAEPLTTETVLAYLRHCGDNVTFAELMRLPGARGDCTLSRLPNVVVWTDMSEALCEALNELNSEQRIHYDFASPWAYWGDGAALSLPLLDIAMRPPFETPHWLPLVIKVGPRPPEECL